MQKRNSNSLSLLFAFLLMNSQGKQAVSTGSINQHVEIAILCTISLAISYVTHLFSANLRAVPINFNCNDENRILGK